MNDPRFDSTHLEPHRRARYEIACQEMLDTLGGATSDFERTVRSRRAVPAPLVGPARYVLRHTQTGQRYPLRVGTNAVGRSRANDVVLTFHAISRRHCVIIVHATGGCEVHDTASRNGTFVNARPISRTALHPGDVLRLCDDRFLVLVEPAECAEHPHHDEPRETGDLDDTGPGSALRPTEARVTSTGSA